MTATIPITTAKPYDIHITCAPLLSSLTSLLDGLSKTSAVIVDANVLACYPALASLNTLIFTLPPGENTKSRAQKAKLEDQLFASGINRQSILIAMGGGVTLDLVGFVAATFCRGIPVVYIPTSLLAMIDACIGGKNGINTPFGKNTLGTFVTPQQIWINLSWLSSLSKQDFANGLTESLKHALIADAPFFDWHLQNRLSILNLDLGVLQYLIRRNLEIKTSIVEQDELEQLGIRALLNYGHTIGHALEACSHYSLPHGSAVALGILAENRIAEQMGLLRADDAMRIGQTLSQFGCLQALPSCCDKRESILQWLKYDKKQSNETIHAILLRCIGTAHQTKQGYLTPIQYDSLLAAIDWLQRQSRDGFFKCIESTD